MLEPPVVEPNDRAPPAAEEQPGRDIARPMLARVDPTLLDDLLEDV